MAKNQDRTSTQGLTAKEASARLTQYGYNELSASKKNSLAALLMSIVQEPMIFILVASIAIYALLGEKMDAIMLSSFVFVVLGMTIYEERKTEHALESLRDLSSPRAMVIRDGVQVRIAGREVAVGDVMIIQEGTRIAADARIFSSTSITVDESLLTGESVPVRKEEDDGTIKQSQPGGDGLPYVYAGTIVVQGHGLAEVTATGARTEMGKIGKSLETVQDEDTLLKKETRKIIKKVFIASMVVCALVVVIYGLTRGNWAEGILMGLTLSMSLLPQEFSVVLTVFLTLGAWRVSRHGVLTRNIPVVETLGATTVLCVDKTGTLTQNQMEMYSFFDGTHNHRLEDFESQQADDQFQELLRYGILSCQLHTFDPMEKAIKTMADRYFPNELANCNEGTHLKEYPISKGLLALTQVWQFPGTNTATIATKGAPETIFDLCRLDQATKATYMAKFKAMADDGLRVLGVARGSHETNSLPDSPKGYQFEFLGLIGFIDPIRPSVPEAITECYGAGIRVAMITGDYAGTAQHIARQVGIPHPEEVLTGDEIDRLSADELAQKVRTVNVFARVAPEQKLLIVNAFKANGEVVAMTGDGVNDAPALKAAHVGLAMGERGTDVAREAADLVLLKDDFGSIVSAVRTGRKIYDNLKKAMSYIIAAHLPIAGLSLFPVLFGWPIILLPAHIAFLELVINPACSAVFEGEKSESDLMHRAPRKITDSIFTRTTFWISALQGVSVLAVVTVVYVVALFALGKGEAEARTLAFTTLIIANLSQIVTNRSWKHGLRHILSIPNRAMNYVVGGTLVFLGLVLFVPTLRTLFHFDVLHLDDLGICLLAGMVSVAWFEAIKSIRLARHQKTILGDLMDQPR